MWKICNLIILFLITYISIHIASGEKFLRCRYIYDNSFEKCGSSQVPMYQNNVYTSHDPISQEDDTPCPMDGICGKTFNITRLNGQTLDRRILTKIIDMLHHCCGGCGKYELKNLSTDLSHLDASSVQSSDIIYPVIGLPTISRIHGFQYIPIFEATGAYYFTLAMTDKEKIWKIIIGCLSMWPLIIICILWALIAGFFIWLFETRNNFKEFPRSFIHGVLNGLWWSIISMTTLGYGDKIPKHPLGRIVTVIWVIIGITITSLYISGLADVVYSISASPTASLNGRVVGVLKHHLQDMTIVAQHGGILIDIDPDDPITGVTQLFKKLENKSIEGFVISKADYQDFFHKISHGGQMYSQVKKFVEQSRHIRTELDFKGKNIVIGILLRSTTDYEYFKGYFGSNWSQIQACNAFDLNSKDRIFKKNEQSLFEGLFFPFFYATLAVLMLILTFGVLYELHRYKFQQSITEEKIELFGKRE